MALFNGLFGSLYLVDEQFNLFEDTAVELLHEELSVLIVTKRLMSINADGVCQFGDVVGTLPVHSS